MNPSTNQGYGNFSPPKQEKRHPLTRQDTEILYQAACEYPDRETELAVRAILDYGLRVGELAHCRSHWIDKEYQRKLDEKLWRISVPKVDYCFGGLGGGIGKGNPDGANLHQTNQPCTKCVNRSWKRKIDDGDGWLTEQQKEEYDFAPKTERSATKVWQFPETKEMLETAKMLKQFLEAQDHQQWPHSQNTIRKRVNDLIEYADLTLPDRSQPKVVPHALRHTYGCRLVEMGVGEGAGMKQMRHEDPDVFRWYSDIRGTRVVSALADAVSENDSLLHE